MLDIFREVKNNYYWRKAYSEFEDFVRTAQKEDHKRGGYDASVDELEDSFEWVNRALNKDPNVNLGDVDVARYRLTLVRDGDPVDFNEFKEYFENLEDLEF